MIATGEFPVTTGGTRYPAVASVMLGLLVRNVLFGLEIARALSEDGKGERSER